MTQAEREILEGRSKCAFEVIKQLQKRCFLLRGEVKRLREENRELRNKYVEIGAWIETISDIVEGKEPSDFMLSYPLVREVADKVSEVKRLRRQIAKKDKERIE